MSVVWWKDEVERKAATVAWKPYCFLCSFLSINSCWRQSRKISADTCIKIKSCDFEANFFIAYSRELENDEAFDVANCYPTWTPGSCESPET